MMADFFYPAEIEQFATECLDDLLLKSDQVMKFNRSGFLSSKLNQEERQQVLAHFMAVNKAFFGEKTVTSSGYSDDVQVNLTGFTLYEQMAANVMALTRLGHPNVLAYPFSLFLLAIDDLTEAYKNG